MQVGELSARTGVSIRALRYYEESGLLPARRLANGYRSFDSASVERVRAIKDLLDTGFTIEEIVSLASCLDDVLSETNCRRQTAGLYRTKLAKIDGQLRTLTTLRERIVARLKTLDQQREITS
jgi:DNA-binding transcriptional MerR regulator